MNTALRATEMGRQVALTGILPQTADYLVKYFISRVDELSAIFRDEAQRHKFDFAVMYSCLTSHEFSGHYSTRFIPYGLALNFVPNPEADEAAAFSAEPTWTPYFGSANAASLLTGWINGRPIGDLERRYKNVRAGMIETLAREIAWCLSGSVKVLAAATRPELPEEERPAALRGCDEATIQQLRDLVSPLKILTWQLTTGLPKEILWISNFQRADGRRLISRAEGLAIWQRGLVSFEDLRMRRNWESLIEAFRAIGSGRANERARELQEAANHWHEQVRERNRERQKRALSPEKAHLIDRFYEAREKGFQEAFEALMTEAGVEFELFDDGSEPNQFDYVVKPNNRNPFVIECKSKHSGFVSTDDASKVISNAQLSGHGDKFCVTLCQPGINPDVPAIIERTTNLAVVETHDMAEALIRIFRGKLSADGMADWLTQPGQSKSEDLYMHVHG